MLSQSYMFAVGKYGTPDLWGMKTMNDPITHQIMAGNLSEFMKLTENCIGKDSDYIKNIVWRQILCLILLSTLQLFLQTDKISF